MKARWLLPLLSVLVLMAAPPASAVEPYQEFVEGLRERQFYDTALDYLEWAESRTDVPPEVRAVIPYEKAATLLQAAKVQRNPETANEYLDRARAFLEQFLKNSPEHELAGQANTELAQVLIGKGKVAVIQSRAPSNEGKKADFQKEARGYFTQARKVFQAAHDQHLANWKKFPTFIDKAKEPKQFEARGQAELDYIQAQLNLALVTYEEAQTYDNDSAERQKVLTDAATQFEEMYKKYRTQVAGLYARMWQGKCFEEQRDLRKAMGLYNELLSHPGDSPTMQKLQDQVRLFRLISLNTPEMHDHQLVIQEAQEWLARNKAKANTRIGIGIRWELARAFEELANRRETPDSEKTRLRQQALSSAREISRKPGEYRDPAQTMISRLLVDLQLEEGDPTDFVTAFGKSRQLITDQLTQLRDAVSAATNKEEKAKAEADLRVHLLESARILQLAISLADSSTEAKDLNRVRYWLAYVNLLLDRPYDAAILAEFVARRYAKDEDNGAIPLDSAYLAMAAYAQAYNAKSNTDKTLDIERMIGIANFVTQTWPQSSRAIDAQMMLGDMYSRIQKPVEAAQWYDKIPPTATDRYLDAQLAAGQAYWAAYLAAGQQSDEERPEQQQLEQYQKLAQDKLKKGIAELESKLAEGEKLPEKLIFAKLTFAQMANGSGQYKEAIALLETGPRPIIPETTVAAGAPRPERGPQAKAFASEAYRQLLRAYIGIQDLEAAKRTMTQLEGLDPENVTELYKQLGEQFKAEVEQLSKTNPQQYQVVLKSFESFLQNLLERKEGQTFNTLYWVGETYFGLGEGVSDKSQANGYFSKAATAFEDIQTRAASDLQFATADQLAHTKFRLVQCKRRGGEYEEALKLVKEILAERKNALDAQFEAAYIYQDWAASGGTDSLKLWDTAMRGVKAEKPTDVAIWGWGDIGNRLMMQLSTKQNTDYVDQFLEARYNLATARHRLGLAQSGEKKRIEQLKLAEQDITYTTALQELSEEWYAKFNDLYRKNLEAMGEIPRQLEIPEIPKAKPVVAKTASPTGATKKAAPAPVAAASAPAAAAESSNTMLWFGVFLVAAVGLMGAVIYFGSRKPKRKTVVAAYAAPPVIAAPGKPAARPAAKSAAKPEARPPASASGAAAASGAAPRPRPKPRPAAGGTPGSGKPSGSVPGGSAPGGGASGSTPPRSPNKPAE